MHKPVRPIPLPVALICHQLNNDQMHSFDALNSSSGVSFSVISTMLELRERDGAGDSAGVCCLVFLLCLFGGGGVFLVVEGRLLAISEVFVV
jgi:hypothetical protein